MDAVALRAEMHAAQDDCLIAIDDGCPLPWRQLKVLPPWRAVLIARVANRAGVSLELGTLGQLVAEARAVTGSGELGDWWMRACPECGTAGCLDDALPYRPGDRPAARAQARPAGRTGTDRPD
jgi:hypothetical protein